MMARFLRVSSFMVVIFFSARVAFAAGGACPAAAVYGLNGNQTLSAAWGITGCYYVSTSGNNSNTGTDEAHPWKFAPGMGNCDGNCSTSVVGPGIGIIFEGGDTWDEGNPSATNYMGTAPPCSVNNTRSTPLCLSKSYIGNGTSTNQIYYGFDPNWYSGTSFSRPILTGDNPTSTSAVSFCSYQSGNNNDMVDFELQQYIVFDNFELTGLCEEDVGQPPGTDDYLIYGAISSPVTFERLYIHGWTHLAFADANGHSGCTPSTVCFNIFAFYGTDASRGETIKYSVVDGSDSDPAGGGVCYAPFYDVSDSVFRYTSQCIPQNMHTFHDNLYEYFYENGHSDMFMSDGEYNGTNVFYNNVFRHVEESGMCPWGACGGGGMIWLYPASGNTDYIFDNLAYYIGGIQYLDVGSTQSNGEIIGEEVFFNNVWQLDSAYSAAILRSANLGSGSPYPVDSNNQYIDDQSPYDSTIRTSDHAVILTNSQATADNYVPTGTYAYAPPNGSAATVGTGTNRSTYCSDLSSAGLTDAAAACADDTTYACTYNATDHTVSCPARSPVARLSTWDVGAYQYDSKNTSQIPSPTNLTAIAQ